MRRYGQTWTMVVLAGLFVACGTGAGGSEEEFTYGQYALSAENGGFTEEDGLPAFAQSEMAQAEEPEELPYEADDQEELEAGAQAPGKDTYILRVGWGQSSGNPDIQKPTAWNGFIHASGARLFVERVVLFEKHDFFKPCKNRRCIFIDSLTRPHHDGLVLRVVPDKEAPASGEPVVSIDFQGLYGRVIPLSQLDGLTEITVVDGLGNKVVLEGFAQSEKCPGGFLRGVWMRISSKGGIFVGKFVRVDGAVDGLIAGIWGRNKQGKRVFFGKYVDSTGLFKGILKGTYVPYSILPNLPSSAAEGGVFFGKWVAKSKVVLGILRGHYALPDVPGAPGVFSGKYRRICSDGKLVKVCPGAVGMEDTCMSDPGKLCYAQGQPVACKCVKKDDGANFCVCNGCPAKDQPGLCMDTAQCDDSGLGVGQCQCQGDPMSASDSVDCQCALSPEPPSPQAG